MLSLVTPSESDVREPRVFIVVKTSLDGVYQERISQARRTWLRDALAEPRVEVKFFVGKSSGASSLSAVGNDTNNLKKSTLLTAGASVEEDTDFSSLVVSLPFCKEGYGKFAWTLTCKTFGSMRYFLQQRLQPDSAAATDRIMGPSGPPPSFFCNFDDDTYVLIPALLRTLSEYQHKAPWYGTNLYIGMPTWKDGIHMRRVQKDPIHFHTGGAWCLSSDMIRRGEQHLESISLKRLPDDVAVGYFVQEKLKVTQVEDSRFHSHFEDQSEVPRDRISSQVAFAYTNKDGNFDDMFADVPRLFAERDDPLPFRSLRCFLLRERSEQQNDSEAQAEYDEECHAAVDDGQ